MSKNCTRKAASTGERPGDSKAGAEPGQIVSGLRYETCSVCGEQRETMLFVRWLHPRTHLGATREYRCQSCPEPEPAKCKCGAVPVYGWCKRCKVLV